MKRFILALTCILAMAAFSGLAQAQDCTNTYVVWSDAWDSGVALVNPGPAPALVEYELWQDGKAAVTFATGIAANDVQTFALSAIAPSKGEYVLRVCGANVSAIGRAVDGGSYVSW